MISADRGADGTSAAFAVSGTVDTFVLLADFAVFAVDRVATIALLTKLFDAERAGGTVYIGGTTGTLALFADLALFAVFVINTTLTGTGSGVTLLVVSAVAVFATTVTTAVFVTDLVVSAICVSGAGFAFVAFADFAVFALGGVLAVSSFAKSLKTLLTKIAVSVGGTIGALAILADLAGITVSVVAAGVFDTKAVDTLLSAVAIIINFAIYTLIFLADLAAFAIGVFGTGHTFVIGGDADTFCTIVVFEAFATGLRCLVTDLTCLTIVVFGAAFDTFAFFAKIFVATIGVFGTSATDVIEADFSVGAGVFFAVTIAFFTDTTNTDLACVTLAIFHTGHTLTAFADRTASTIAIVGTGVDATGALLADTIGAIVVLTAFDNLTGTLFADFAIFAAAAVGAGSAGASGVATGHQQERDCCDKKNQTKGKCSFHTIRSIMKAGWMEPCSPVGTMCVSSRGERKLPLLMSVTGIGFFRKHLQRLLNLVLNLTGVVFGGARLCISTETTDRNNLFCYNRH